MLYAVLDKDLSSKILMKSPFFYSIGIEGRNFNSVVFWQWFFLGAIHALFICILTLFVMNSFSPDGYSNDLITDG